MRKIDNCKKKQVSKAGAKSFYFHRVTISVTAYIDLAVTLSHVWILEYL